MSRLDFGAMTGGQFFMLALSTVVALGVVTAFAMFTDPFPQVVITGLLVVILILGARVAMPAEAHRMRAARYAVWVFGGVLLLIAGARTYMDALIASGVEYFFPATPLPIPDSSLLAPGVLVLVATVIMFVSFLVFLRDAPPLGTIARHPLIPEPNYDDRRAGFVSVLKSHLERVDDELRWHHRDFVALRAEVDVRNSEHSNRRVSDLVKAIKWNRDAAIFVVVGVPGSGKSVALRKCCTDLLSTQRRNERIPIYVNLKEWAAHRRWSAESPPTDAEFADFVRSNVRGRLPDRAQAFFDDHFSRMVDTGELFFFFDSFDEIPGILDADEASRLLDAVSAVIVRYLRAQTRGRSVIASRYYRRPRLGQERHVQLDVRPFSERQIAQAITQGASRPDALKRLLFKERPELGALARNPFTLSLILLHWESKLETPPNQSALFANYIDRSLADAAENVAAAGLDAEQLREAMADISWAMFESDRRGLEMTVGELRHALRRDDIDTIVDLLVGARLVRKAPRTQAVSFVHRRFNEYFLVARWLSGERAVPLEAIPTDSRYRDALVLYAEVADDADAERLATFCWHEIETISPHITEALNVTLRGIYALRFLTEAFRARLNPVAPFRNQLGARVRSIVGESDDILTRKIAVESVGLLSTTDAEAVLVSAISYSSSWISETAFSACRYLPALPRSVEDALFINLASRDQIWILAPDREFKFTLGMADSFRSLRARFNAFQFDVWLSLVAATVALVSIQIDTGYAAYILAFAATLCGVVFFVNVLIARAIFSGVRGRLRVRLTTSVRVEPAVLTLFSTRLGFIEFLIGLVRVIPLLVALLVLVQAIEQALPDIEKVSFEPLGVLTTFRLNDEFYYSPGTVFASSLALASLPLGTLTFLATRRRISVGAAGKFATLVLTGIVACILVVGIVGLLLPYVPRKVLAVILIVIMGMSVVPLVGASVMSLLISFARWRRDRRRLASAITRFNPSRAVIGETFEGFETDAARLRYVRWIERESQASEALARLANIAANPWPDGRPNVLDSPASTILAQLDARWLGLDV